MTTIHLVQSPAPAPLSMSFQNLMSAIRLYEIGIRAAARRKTAIMTAPTANPKLALSSATLSLSLAPAAMSGIDICPSRSPACTAGCLGHNSGHSVMGLGAANDVTVLTVVRQARIQRTKELFGAFGQEAALAALGAIDREIRVFNRKCLALSVKASVRMNAFSDIIWEQIWPELFQRHAGVQFYDYTKIQARFGKQRQKTRPANYHLTFSRSEQNEQGALAILAAGGTVAVVFAIKAAALLPATWNGFRVIDATRDDMRFLDPAGCVAGLVWKGPAGKAAYATSLQNSFASGFSVEAKSPVLVSSTVS